MKALVLYDSAYGNTEKIARAIAKGLNAHGEVDIARVADVTPAQLAGLTLLVAGSPTQKFHPLKSVSDWLDSIPSGSLKGIGVAAFDTRFTEQAIDKIRILSLFVKIFGYAAKDIEGSLVKNGGKPVAPPEGFYVGDTEGPLLEGELERAAAWAVKLAAAAGV